MLFWWLSVISPGMVLGVLVVLAVVASVGGFFVLLQSKSSGAVGLRLLRHDSGEARRVARTDVVRHHPVSRGRSPHGVERLQQLHVSQRPRRPPNGWGSP